MGPEARTPSRLAAADFGSLLSRLRRRPGVLGGLEREGQELNVAPELGLPVWVLPPLAPSGFVLLPHALLVLIDNPANITYEY